MDVDSLSRFFAFALLALVVVFVIACGASEEDSGEFFEESDFSQTSFDSDDNMLEDDMDIVVSSERDTSPEPSDQTTSVSTDDSDGGSDADQLESGYPPVSAQNRLIVRIVDLALEVDDVERRMSDVSGVAASRNGWVVSESRASRHSGTISIRVPSAQLDDAVRAISALGLEVLSLSSTSQDVTEEYFDVQSRITNLNVTRDSLRELLSREGELEDILAVQQEITRVSEEIEILEGRKRYLEQTSATSLINVRLELVPGTMNADAGPDLQAVEGRPVAFRATFTEPEGIESYEYWWEFGDGNVSDRRFRTAITETPGERVTEIVQHRYSSSEQSPYFVTFMIRGTGDAGVVDGEDSIKVNVERVPTIIVSAEDSATIRAGDEITLTATFTRPENVSTLHWEWDFGDGLIPAAGEIGEGVQEISATHQYTIDRHEPYEARFGVWGETDDFGAYLSSSTTVLVYVEPSSEWVVGILDIPETARSATRTLSAIAQGLIVLGIWVALLSPVWGAVVALIWFLRRRTSIGLPFRRRRDPDPEPEGAETMSDSGDAPDTEDAESDDDRPS